MNVVSFLMFLLVVLLIVIIVFILLLFVILYKITIMNARIVIDVDVPDHINPGSFKNVIHRVVSLDDSVEFDFRSVIRGLCCIFPTDVVMSFKYMP